MTEETYDIYLNQDFEVDRNARAYGYEIGRGKQISASIETSDDNPFLDPHWRDKMTTEHPLGTREYLAKVAEGRHQSTWQVLQHFAWGHLPEKLQLISRPCADLAVALVRALPDGPELTAGLRKLLEAKDCFVRAAID